MKIFKGGMELQKILAVNSSGKTEQSELAVTEFTRRKKFLKNQEDEGMEKQRHGWGGGRIPELLIQKLSSSSRILGSVVFFPATLKGSFGNGTAQMKLWEGEHGTDSEFSA